MTKAKLVEKDAQLAAKEAQLAEQQAQCEVLLRQTYERIPKQAARLSNKGGIPKVHVWELSLTEVTDAGLESNAELGREDSVEVTPAAPSPIVEVHFKMDEDYWTLDPIKAPPFSVKEDSYELFTPTVVVKLRSGEEWKIPFILEERDHEERVKLMSSGGVSRCVMHQSRERIAGDQT